MIYLRKSNNMIERMKTFNTILSALTFLFLLLIPIVSSDITEIIIAFGDGTTIQLGSGVNITENTLIKLTGVNCNLTTLYDHSMDSLEVHPTYLLINASLNPPTWIEGLSYTYSDDTKQINITCQDMGKTFYVNTTSDLGAGIKIYSVSEPAYITSASWSDADQNFTFTVNASSGITSTTEINWRDSFGPDIVECTAASWTWNFDPGTQIVTLTATHSSPVTWTLHVQTEGEAPQWSDLKHGPQTVITTLDDVAINVTWSDDVGLDTVIIWENSTGEWQGHVV